MKPDGQKILSEIVLRKMTIVEFAKKAGLMPATVRRAICGENCTTRTIGKIMAALGIVDLDAIRSKP